MRDNEWGKCKLTGDLSVYKQGYKVTGRRLEILLLASVVVIYADLIFTS
ncbi:hypothetical protein ACFLWC_02475 [Chloroflexota bacterium]